MSPRKKPGNVPPEDVPGQGGKKSGGSKKSTAGHQKVNGGTGEGSKLKIFWAVFNDAFEPVALFAYADHAKAQKKAHQLSQTLRVPHFVQKIKRLVNE